MLIMILTRGISSVGLPDMNAGFTAKHASEGCVCALRSVARADGSTEVRTVYANNSVAANLKDRLDFNLFTYQKFIFDLWY